MAALHVELADLMVLAAAGGAVSPPVLPARVRSAVQPAVQSAARIAVQSTGQGAKPVAKQPQAVAKAVPATAPKESQAAALAVTAGKTASQTEQQRMQAHLARTFKGVNGNRDDAAKALEKAWRAVLNDRLLHGDAGISVPLFGSLGTPLVKQHHGSLQKVLGMQLRK